MVDAIHVIDTNSGGFNEVLANEGGFRPFLRARRLKMGVSAYTPIWHCLVF